MFEEIGEALVDPGSPMRNGLVLRSDGATSDSTNRPLGYSIVQAEDRPRVLELLRHHPLWRSRPDYTIEMFEVPRK